MVYNYTPPGGTVEKEAKRLAGADSKTLDQLPQSERFGYYRKARINSGLTIPGEDVS